MSGLLFLLSTVLFSVVYGTESHTITEAYQNLGFYTLDDKHLFAMYPKKKRGFREGVTFNFSLEELMRGETYFFEVESGGLIYSFDYVGNLNDESLNLIDLLTLVSEHAISDASDHFLLYKKHSKFGKSYAGHYVWTEGQELLSIESIIALLEKEHVKFNFSPIFRDKKNETCVGFIGRSVHDIDADEYFEYSIFFSLKDREIGGRL